MITRLILAALLLFAMDCRAQQFVNVMDQLFTVHSAGNAFVNSNSNSRNIVEVHLPRNTLGYIYRVSSKAKNAAGGQNEQLYELLKGLAPKQIVMEAALAQFAVQQADGQAVDVFAFTGPGDANSFLRKQDNSWQACWFNMGVINVCFARNTCLNPVVYFGFRNNNLATGVDVHLEVVAIVDNASGTQSGAYTYSIGNGSNQSLNYLLSGDQVNWERHVITAGDNNTLNSQLAKLYVRLVTTITNMVTYEIQPGQRYRIIWSNAGRWDLVTY